MNHVVNLAAYKFAQINNLVELRDELSLLAAAQKLRGTILLSSEGLNAFVAGSRTGVDALIRRFRQVPGLESMPIKESFSDEVPFNKMWVKIKREIIAFGVPGIDPRRYASKRLAATELKRWLDEGRPVTLLDTRNRFEVVTGTFENAVEIGVDDFRDFPSAVEKLPPYLKGQPVVTFCTGGIRCEKAAPYLEQAGFTDVYQLDGGILKYFEDCGGAHYNGHCFVFDKRVALNTSLAEGDLRQCFVCLAILTPTDRQSPANFEGVACPHCFETPAEKFAKLLPSRQQALMKACTPLPGSVPYDNVRPISVPLRCDGFELLDFLDAMRTHLSRPHWEQAAAEGRLECRGGQIRPGRIMRAGERLLHKLPATVEPDVATDIRILHEDEAIVVVHKPAPLPMHPCGRFNRNSLSYLLDEVYHPIKLKPAHRLDADTSGVVVFCKTREFSRDVQCQFLTGAVKKTYLAKVQGHPAAGAFECNAPISRVPGDAGARRPAAGGAPASTAFRVLARFGDRTALLHVTPATGRTNQIRAHLWEMNLPIVGDPIYLPDRRLGSTQSLSITDPPLCLHAIEIEFEHPISKQSVRYTSPEPPWAQRPAER